MADSIITFDEDIAPILKPYRNAMLRQSIATPDGVFELDLTNYESVKYLNERITIALHGHEEGRESTYPMPPGGPLEPDELQKWDAWVAGGMIKNKNPVA